jgi:hypothetical protein
MSGPAPQAKQQCLANLAILQKQLEELAAGTKRPGSQERDQREEAKGPLLIIRGK